MSDSPSPGCDAERNHRLKLQVRLRLILVLAAVVVLGVVVYILATVPPTENSWYPKCTLHSATGLHCPGCGTTRAAHAMLNGHPLAAFQFNLFAPFLLTVFTFLAVRALLGWAFRKPHAFRISIPTVWLWGFVVLFMAYAVLRNIPTEPFSYLAPREFGATQDP